MTAAEAAGGVLLAAAASGCYELGYAIQALEARVAPEGLAHRPALFTHLLRRRRWLLATALAGFGWPLQLLALRLAPLTAVQPTLALGLLLLLVLAVRMLGEHVGTRELLGALAIVAGTVAIALVAPGHTNRHGNALHLIVTLGPLGVIAACPLLVRPLRVSLSPGLLVAACGAADAWAAIATKLVADDIGSGKPFAAAGWGVAAAAMFAACLLSEMSALQKWPASRVGTSVAAAQVSIPVLLAPIAVHEHWRHTALHGGVILIGLLIVLVGVALIADPLTRLAEEREGRSSVPQARQRLSSARTASAADGSAANSA